MQKRKWKFVDKSQWGDGPWQREPDKIQWQDQKTGMPCLIVRHKELGHLCGYVGVTREHPLFQHGSDDVDLSAHGGITFASLCAPEDKEHGVCHIVDPGEDDVVWWFGFDFAHCGDLSPGLRIYTMGISRPHPGEKYKTISY